MKAIAFGNRLARDLDAESVVDLTADTRLEILDAINGGLQTLHAHAPFQSKTTTGSITLAAPAAVTLGVTQGSVQITGHAFSSDQVYRTLRIDGDTLDNQVTGTAELLHPYSGATGTVTATLYGDAAQMPEPYEEMLGDPMILETGRRLVHQKIHRNSWQRVQVGEPCAYWIESNARNRNSLAPAVIRFDRMPDRIYRLEAQFTLAPARVNFSDLLAPGADIPLRAEYIEVYLLPIARAILTSSRLWKDPETKAQARAAAETAESKYDALVPRTIATPNGRVRTRHGY